MGGIAVIIHNADPSIFFGHHDDESQEAWGIADTMSIRIGTPTVAYMLYRILHTLWFAPALLLYILHLYYEIKI